MYILVSIVSEFIYGHARDFGEGGQAMRVMGLELRLIAHGSSGWSRSKDANIHHADLQ